MLIYFILFITLMNHVWIGTTFDVRRPTRDRMSARNVVISIFGSNANKPDSPTANLKEKMLRIPSNNNFHEIVLAELGYNNKLSTKPLVQIYPLRRKFITRPYYPILFNIPSTDLCCVENGRIVLNNNRFVKHYVPHKDTIGTTNKLVPLITKNKGIFNHKDNSPIDGIETKKDITETDMYNQSRIHTINQEQSIIVSNVSVETEKIIPAYNGENSKRKLVDYSSQLKDVGNKDLKDIKMHENETTSVPETDYDQHEEVMSTTEVIIDIEEKNKNEIQFINYTLKSPEPVHSNNNINTYTITEQVKIKKDFIPDLLKKYIPWSELYSSIAKINTSIPLKGFENVTNNFTVSDIKSKIQSSQKQKDVKDNVVQQRIIMNSDNISNDSVAYIKSKLSLSNLATLDKPILFLPEKPEFYNNKDDSETLVRKRPKLSLKEGNRGDIPDFYY